MDADKPASIYNSIPGGEELLNWFGREPDFHDAEIIDFHLKRKGWSILSIHAWNMTSKVRNGYYVLEKHAVVDFWIGRIFALELEDFNHQNVIDGLTISHVEIGKLSKGYELNFEPCFGLTGNVCAEDLSITFEPGKPEK